MTTVYQTGLLLSWLFLTLEGPLTINGQGVFLQLNGVRLLNNSLVDIDDIPDEIIYVGYSALVNALMCVTDLVECCNAGEQFLPQNLGEWYYPNGSLVLFDADGATFRRNRGQSVVRLWRRDIPPDRGLFRCEIPNATNPTVNQSLYVHILTIGTVNINSPSGSNTGTAGISFSLECSATAETQTDSPTPNFEWFYGRNNGSVPSGATAVATVVSSGNTYTSTLQFSPLQESHAGMYACRLGRNARLANNITIDVNRPTIVVAVIANRAAAVLGNSYVLTCGVSGDETLGSTLAYQWTRDNGTTQTPVGTNSSTLSFSPLSLSDTGRYTCRVTVSSPYLNSDVVAASSGATSPTVMFQIPNPSVTVTSNPSSPVLDGTDVTLICTVEMGQGVLQSDISLLMIDVQMTKDGSTLALTGPTVIGTTFTYTIQLDSFGRRDSGNYTCKATVSLRQPSIYLTGMGVLSAMAKIVTGVYLSRVYRGASAGTFLLTDIGEGDNSLLCFTDLIQCCHDSDTPSGVGALGEWLFPNGSAVGADSQGEGFYVDRGPGMVRLNRRNGVTSPTGQFCCELPDATSTNTKTCINIVAIDEGASVSSCTTTVSISVTIIILIECLLAMPIISILVIIGLKKRKQCKKSNYGTAPKGVMGEEKVYEDPDKHHQSGRGQGSYKLTESPAYDVIASKPKVQDCDSEYEL